ncbi:MAG: 50S ribosomal protein L25 [Bacillota bacterium]
MKKYEIEVEARKETGKGAARKLRRQGKIPGVVYGKERNSQPLSVDPRDLYDKINKNAIIDLVIDGEQESETVMIKDYQRDVIKNKLLHVDFQKISMEEKIDVTVPINLVGEAPGVQEGGVLQQLMREVEISVLPEDIPEEIDLDISELEVGDSLQVQQLQSEGIDVLASPEDVIVTVVTPTEEIEEEVEEELEEEFIEPEVIGEEGEEELEEGEVSEEEEAEESREEYY